MNKMAETMFDEIAKRYEAAFSEDPSLHQIIDRVLPLLPHSSSVLDVGCGTGKPVSYRIASAGHRVIGIDISQEMLKIAKRQVVGQAEFVNTDMNQYSPAAGMSFDAIFAVFSLFNISRAQTVQMLCKFREWLAPGGRLVIATIPADCMFDGEALYDVEGLWVDQKPMYFMGHDFVGSAAKVAGWYNVLHEQGFEIESELRYQFASADREAHKADPDHQYFVATVAK